MKNKDYEVNIMEKYSHGCHGKTIYGGWVLNASSKTNAETFAYDILLTMTYQDLIDEFFNNYQTLNPLYIEWILEERIDFVDNGVTRCRYEDRDLTQKISEDFIDSNFTIKASILQ